MEDVFKYAEDALKLFMLEKADLPIRVLMSMFMLEILQTIGLSVVSLVVLGINVFATSLIDTTI